MHAFDSEIDETFENLLRFKITEAVIFGADRGAGCEELVTRLRSYDLRARQERLGPQTLQVISSALRLLGDGAQAGRRS